MQIALSLRNRLLAAAIFAIVAASAPMPAHAASKEIIELQTQVQQLLDMMQRVQSTLDARFGVLQNLAQQTADNATQMTAIPIGNHRAANPGAATAGYDAACAVHAGCAVWRLAEPGTADRRQCHPDDRDSDRKSSSCKPRCSNCWI